MDRALLEVLLAGQVPATRGSPDNGRRGDDLFATGTPYDGPLTPAAVLVPLVERLHGFSIMLTERTAHLRDHAGQISFPGGRVETWDASAESAALREAQEEIGVAPEQVEVLSRLDTYETRTGYEVVPVVGVVEPDAEIVQDPFEVASVFEVPLAFVLDPVNHVVEERVFQGARRQFYVLQYEDRYIWGATAGMLINLYEVLAKP